MATSHLTTQLRANIRERYDDFNTTIQVRRTKVDWMLVREQQSLWRTKEQALVMIMHQAFEDRAAIHRLFYITRAGEARLIPQAEAIAWFCDWWNGAHPLAHKHYGGAYLWCNIAWEYLHD